MKRLIIIIVAAMIIAGGCSKGRDSGKGGFIPVKVGNQANDFLYNDVDEKPFMLSKERGKVVLVYFWTMKCKECADSMESLDALNRKYKDRGLVIVAIVAETSQTAPMYELNKFIQKGAYGFRVIRDEDGIISEAFEVLNAPQAFIINKKGVINSIVQGKTDWMSADNARLIESLLGES